MTAEEILAYCLQKPYATIDHPFGPDSTIVKVKPPNYSSRIFAQLFDLKGQPHATFCCDAVTGDFYRQMYPGIVVRGYHCPPVQQPYFNTLPLNGKIPDEEIIGMIDHSFKAVVSRYPKYVQRAFLKEDNK